MITIIIHSKSKYFVYFTSSKWYESFCLAYTIIIIQGIFLPTQLLLPTLLLIFDKMPTYTFIPTYMIIRDTRVHLQRQDKEFFLEGSNHSSFQNSGMGVK